MKNNWISLKSWLNLAFDIWTSTQTQNLSGEWAKWMNNWMINEWKFNGHHWKIVGKLVKIRGHSWKTIEKWMIVFELSLKTNFWVVNEGIQGGLHLSFQMCKTTQTQCLSGERANWLLIWLIIEWWQIKGQSIEKWMIGFVLLTYEAISVQHHSSLKFEWWASKLSRRSVFPRHLLSVAVFLWDTSRLGQDYSNPPM